MRLGAVRAPVGPYMRARILAGLCEAVEIARGDLGGQVERFREVICDLAERVDAVLLTALGADGSEDQALSSRLCVTALGRESGEPVCAFLLIPFGEVKVDRPVSGEGFVFTEAHARSAKAWFDRIGRKLAIDYEHQSFDQLNTRSDGLRPAAGWIGGLEVRSDGLWATDVTWTPRAAELLRSGEYRYFSPVIYWTDEARTDVAALGPVALTNDPAMRGVPPLAARSAGEEAGALDTSDLAEGRGPVAVPVGAGELTALRQELLRRDADAFVERGMSAGKIVASTREDWRDDYLRDGAAAEARLARAPVVLPPGRAVRLDPRGEVARLQAVEQRGAGRNFEAADLEAYERAAASGRVAGLGGGR